MSKPGKSIDAPWNTTHGDLTDDEWELIADLVAPWWKPGEMGRPATVDRRRVVDAIMYVAATGCQWRALPDVYPNWNTVHRLHLRWSNDGTWEAIVDRLRRLVREREGREADPSAVVVDARTVRGASTVTSMTRGYDAGKKISGRKHFALVDSNGLLVTVGVCPADLSDNAGGLDLIGMLVDKIDTVKRLWCDAGFKTVFQRFANRHHIAVTTVPRVHEPGFHVLPRRWVIERSWSWLMNNRRLQVDYERDPTVTEGFIWAAHARHLLRRLTR